MSWVTNGSLMSTLKAGEEPGSGHPLRMQHQQFSSFSESLHKGSPPLTI